MPSSTSNSDIPYRDIPERRWGQAWLIALPLLIVALVAWEAKARAMLHLPGTYDSWHNFTVQWGLQRRILDEPDHGVRAVLLGSSRMLWAADLDILEQELGTRPLQLAIAGTSPAVMFKGIVEDTDFDGLVLIGVAPFLFNRLNEGFFGGDALKWHTGPSPSERSGYAIHSFLSQHLGFLDDGFKLFELIDHYSTFEDREGSWDLSAGEWKLGDHYEDRQTDMWEPVEEEGSFDNAQLLAFWMLGLGRPPEEPERMAEMSQEAIDYFKPLVEQLRERGGAAVFIRMPGTGTYLEHDLKTRYDELTWAPMMEGIGVTSINTMDIPMLSTELEIPEWSHVSRKSQDEFSRRIVPVVNEAYTEFSGRSIYDVMGVQPPE